MVLGAGASVEARVPRMKEVFAQLEGRLQELVANVEKRAETGAENVSSRRDELLGRLRELRSWFSSLARQGAPRSIAAMALGMMQRAHETTAQGELSELLRGEWVGFSKQCQKKTD